MQQISSRYPLCSLQDRGVNNTTMWPIRADILHYALLFGISPYGSYLMSIHVNFTETIDETDRRTTILSGDYIPTDGSGHLLITDISLTYGQTQTSNDTALFCHATRDVAIVRENWYLQPDFETTTAIGKRIRPKNVHPIQM